MTDNEILAHELLSFLSSQPRQLKESGSSHAGKLAVAVGNTLRVLAYSLEKGKPQIFQPLDEEAHTLYALAMQFREVGLSLWESEPDLPTAKLEREIEALKQRLANLECKKTRQVRSLTQAGQQERQVAA